MSFWLFCEKIHGHIAILAIALSWHPPIALRRARRPSRGVRWSAYLAALFMAAAMGMGWFIYPEYRREVRQQLYVASRTLGRLFEVKEHLGTYALFLVLDGALLVALSRRAAGSDLTPAIRLCFGAAAVLATISAGIGILLASTAGFSYAG